MAKKIKIREKETNNYVHKHSKLKGGVHKDKRDKRKTKRDRWEETDE